MKLKYSNWVVLFIGLLLLSCSKVENEQPLAGEVGGIISRYQIITVDVGENAVVNDTYSGTFNNLPIVLAKVDDNKLLFYVPENTPLGKTQLLIPSLNNTTIVYEIVETVLTQSADATLQPLKDLQHTYGKMLTNTSEDAEYLQNHNLIIAYMNNLNLTEKTAAAKFYKANKIIIDAVYNTKYNTITGKSKFRTQTELDFELYKSLIAQHTLAVAVTVIAGTIATIPPYESNKTIILSGTAIAGIFIARRSHIAIVKDVFRVVQIKLIEEFGTSNRSSNGTKTPLILKDNQAITIPFRVNAQTISNSDDSIQKKYLQNFFNAKNKLNNFITKTNNAIIWIKSNIPFLNNLVLLPAIEAPNNSTVGIFDSNNEVMQRFKFSINHPNLVLEDASLASRGLVSLKVKIIGTPTTSSVKSKLNYTYTDDFSEFSGSFDIEVEKELIKFLGLSLTNRNSIGNGETCKGEYNCNYDQVFTFSGNVTPIGGRLRFKTMWDNEPDGIYEGNANGGLTEVIITAENSVDNKVVIGQGFCWGSLKTNLQIQYQYVDPNGVEGPLLETGVSK